MHRCLPKYSTFTIKSSVSLNENVLSENYEPILQRPTAMVLHHFSRRFHLKVPQNRSCLYLKLGRTFDYVRRMACAHVTGYSSYKRLHYFLVTQTATGSSKIIYLTASRFLYAEAQLFIGVV